MNVKLTNKPKQNLYIYWRITDDHILRKVHSFIHCHYRRKYPLVIIDRWIRR